MSRCHPPRRWSLDCRRVSDASRAAPVKSTRGAPSLVPRSMADTIAARLAAHDDLVRF
jgi:hypothetical protein